MRRRRRLADLSPAFLGAVIPVLAGCSSGAPPDPRESLGRTSDALFTNGGFETGIPGAAPPAPWTLTNFVNINGVALETPQTYAGLKLVAHGAACTTNAQCTGVSPQQGSACGGGFCQPAAQTVVLASAAGPGTQIEPSLGATASLRWPRYGNRCAIVNQLGNHANVNQLSQTMTVDAADVDPKDGQVHVRLVVAPVLEDPGHPAEQQPYFFVQVTNLTQGKVVYSSFNFSNQPGVPWKSVVSGGATYRYTDWQLVDVAPGSPAINLGDQLQLTLVAAGCTLGAHMGELYVDGVGPTIPGLFVSGSGPAQANRGADLTYALRYDNGSPAVTCTTAANCGSGGACVGGVCAATGVVIDFTTPPGTTFKSLTPPPGATCTTPAIGAPGIITCSFASPVAAGASGAFSITVGNGVTRGCSTSAECGAGTSCTLGSCDVWELASGNYAITSLQESRLLGNKIVTLIGCAHDADCPAGNWCNESSHTCTPTLANGATLPVDPPHTSPTLNGTCTSAAAAVVCASGVCDTPTTSAATRTATGTAPRAPRRRCAARGTAASAGAASPWAAATSTGTARPEAGASHRRTPARPSSRTALRCRPTRPTRRPRSTAAAPTRPPRSCA